MILVVLGHVRSNAVEGLAQDSEGEKTVLYLSSITIGSGSRRYPLG